MESVKYIRLKGKLFNFEVPPDTDVHAHLYHFCVEFDESQNVLFQLKLDYCGDGKRMYFFLEEDSEDLPYIIYGHIKCGNEVLHAQERIYSDSDDLFMLTGALFLGEFSMEDFMKNFVTDNVVNYEIVV